MEKNYQVSTGKKTVQASAPVIAQLQLGESAPDPKWVSWLMRQEKAPEKGLVGRRIGGIVLIIAGLPVGIFGLLCFPGLFFWILGPLGLAMIGQGVVLMFSKRSKDPQTAFKNLFKEAFFNADGTAVVFSTTLFKPTEQIKKRILAMSPIAELTIDDAQLCGFTSAFENVIRNSFSQYGGPDMPNSTFAVFVDPEVKVLGSQGTVSAVNGTVNIIRQSQGCSQIIELTITMNMFGLGGIQMPVNPIPHLFDNSSIQIPAQEPQLLSAYA